VEGEKMTDTAPRWFVGVDWARETHQVCVLDEAGMMLGERAFAHGGAGLADLCDWVLATTGAEAGAIAVAIEVPHGPVVETLLERGFQVYAVNPKQLDRFRDRFTVAGAKDDRRDAHVLGDSLRTDRHCLPAPLYRRSRRRRAAGMVAHDRRSAAGTHPPCQSRA
jgi:hypothetical protein